MKKVWAIVLTLILCAGLLPGTAVQAEGNAPETIYIYTNNFETWELPLSDGYFVMNESVSTQEGPPPADMEGYAWYHNGVLTLNNFSNGTREPYGFYLVKPGCSLTLELVGDNYLYANDKAIDMCRGDLTVQGSGRLFIEYDAEDSSAISARSMTVDGCDIQIQATGGCVYADTLSLINGSSVSATSEHADVTAVINCSSLTVNGSELTVNSNNVTAIEADSLTATASEINVESTAGIAINTCRAEVRSSYVSAVSENNNAFVVEDGEAVFHSGECTFVSDRSALKAEGESSIVIHSGAFTIESYGSSSISVEDNSTLTINGGEVELIAADYGIDAANEVTINGGKLDISSNDAGENAYAIRAGKLTLGSGMTAVYPEGAVKGKMDGYDTILLGDDAVERLKMEYVAPVPKKEIKPLAGDNGRVTVSSGTADEGDPVTITLYPEDGYVLDKLTVVDENGEPVEFFKTASDVYSFDMPDSSVSVKATFRAERVIYFVPPADWEYVCVLSHLPDGSVTGTPYDVLPDGRFRVYLPENARFIRFTNVLPGMPYAPSEGAQQTNLLEIVIGKTYANVAVNHITPKPTPKPAAKVPKTGDSAQIALWLSLMGLSLAAMALLTARKRREN